MVVPKWTSQPHISNGSNSSLKNILMSKSLKENSGMGASTRLLRRILVIIGITLFLCFVVTTQRSLVSLNREEAGGGKRTNNGGRNGQQRYRGFNKMVPVRPNSINRGRGEGEEEKSLGNFFLKNGALTNEGKLELILSAKVHLVDIRIPNGALSIHGGNNDNEGDYNGVTGEFCHVDWEKHKNDPSTVPMFRDVVAESRDCSHRRFSYDFKSIVQAAKLRDEDTATTEIKTKSMLPSGFVFHESRCGSTLIANSLVAADPIGHRVYSESGPPITALRACGSSSSSSNQCHPKSAAALLRDVIYMMGRTNDIHKEHSTFFKIQSIGTLSLPIFRLAFPSVPWIFVYRDPVHVMMSQLDVPGGDIRRSNCMRSMMRPSMEYLDAIQEHANGRSVNDLVGVEHCAAHLATICDAARQEQESSYSGIMVNYKNLPDILINTVFPKHFHIPMTFEAKTRIIETCSKYSKNRHNPIAGDGNWINDSEKKEKMASAEVKAASELFLEQSYQWLEEEAEKFRLAQPLDLGEEA